MSRPRKGELIWRKASNSWSARYYDATGKRRCTSLETDNAAVAKQRLAALLDGATPAAVAVPGAETFEAAAVRIVPAAVRDRWQRLRRWAVPAIGPLPVDRIGKSHVRSALKAAASDGAARGTVLKLRSDISAVLSELVADDILAVNHALDVKIPDAAVDTRKRAIPTDGEFELFTASCTDVELRTAAILSRCVGGLRTSDLHELTWRDCDLEAATLTVRRPKTGSEDVHELPPEVVAVLTAWHGATGKPSDGPIFPVPGTRQRKRDRGISYAERFRMALFEAGATRNELHHDTDTSRRCDFHSLRRQYATALATAGVNTMQAMALAGHRNASTHARYVAQATLLRTPSAALPTVRALSVPNQRMPRQRRSRKSRDLLASPARIELATNALGKHCSILLSYGGVASCAWALRRGKTVMVPRKDQTIWRRRVAGWVCHHVQRGMAADRRASFHAPNSTWAASANPAERSPLVMKRGVIEKFPRRLATPTLVWNAAKHAASFSLSPMNAKRWRASVGEMPRCRLKKRKAPLALSS